MPAIYSTGALVHPVFTAADFTATKWDTSDDKAAFANGFCRFMAADFKVSLFTDKMYRRLSNTFGHIAHYNKSGFIAEFFADLRGKVDFIEQTMMWQPGGDPAWTYSDVEHAIHARLRTCDLFTAYRALRAAEIEGAERELLRILVAKFANGAAARSVPILHCPAIPKAKSVAKDSGDQPMLF